MSTAELLSEGLMTVDEVMKVSRMSRSHIYAEMDAGKLPYCKMGRRRMIPRVAVQAWMGENLVGFRPTPEPIPAAA